MSAGITPINSGPLLARLNNDTLTSGTYLFGISNYSEHPISSNYILITSSNGLLAPSNQFYVSSVTVSTFRANTVTLSSFVRSSILVSTLYASTSFSNYELFTTMTGSSIIADNMRVSTLSTQSIYMDTVSFSSLTGYPMGSLTTDTLQYMSSFFSNTSFISTLNVTTITGTNKLLCSTLSNNTISTNLLTGSTLSTSIFYTNAFYLSTFSTLSVSSLNCLESTIVQDTMRVSTIYASTFRTDNLAFSVFNAFTPITINLIAINAIYSSIYGSTISCSTLSGSTTTILQLSTSFGMYSTLIGSTSVTSTLSASSISLYTLLGLSCIYSTLSGSTTTSTLNVTTLLASQTNTSSMNISTLIGTASVFPSTNVSTVLLSTLSASSIYVPLYRTTSTFASTSLCGILNYLTLSIPFFSTSQLSVSTGIYQSLLGSTLSYSTITSSTFYLLNHSICTILTSTTTYSTLYISTLYGSTATFLNINASTMLLSTLYSSIVCNSTLIATNLNISSLINRVLNTSTITTSSINNIILGSYATNTVMGAVSLVNITSGSANTAIGYTSLRNTTTGSYQTAIGTSTLSLNQTGSYHTAIGSGAGFGAGFAGAYTTYIGYGAIPSGSTVINEITVGGVGNGNNSITLGNSRITTTILYGNIGIGTNAPGTALDVRGSYQQIGGNMSITNSTQSRLFLVSDGNPIGCGLFLNTSQQTTDGGTYTATFRNDYGTLRLQSAGGFSNATQGITVLGNGNVGINSNNPVNTFDVIGDVNVSNTTNIYNTINITNSLIVNGIIYNFTIPWYTNGTSIYTLNNTGIGNSNPGAYALRITGNTNISMNMNVIGAITSGAVTSGKITSGDVSCGNITSGSITTTTVNGNNITASSVTSLVNGTDTADLGYTQDVYGNKIMRSNISTGNTIEFGSNWYITGNSEIIVFENPYGILRSRFALIYGHIYTYLLDGDSSWRAFSDRRLKTNINPLNSTLSSVLLLNPVNYVMNDKTHIGFIAQDVQELFPHAVSDSGQNPENSFNSTLLGLSYESLIPCLIKAFQEEHNTVIYQTSQFVAFQPDLIIGRIQSDINTIQSLLLSHDSRLSRLEELCYGM